MTVCRLQMSLSSNHISSRLQRLSPSTEIEVQESEMVAGGRFERPISRSHSIARNGLMTSPTVVVETGLPEVMLSHSNHETTP